MISIVEDYLTELLELKLKYLKDNPNEVSRLLGTSKAKNDMLAGYLRGNRPIKVIKGYPRTPAELPCICIMLSGEEETQEGLGDYGDSIGHTVLEATNELEVLYDDESGHTFVELVNVPAYAVSSVVSNDLGSKLDEYEYVLSEDGKTVFLTSGICEPGDTVTVSYTHHVASMESLSTMFELNYRIEVWTSNGDLTVQLYHLAKWIMLSGRDHLVKDRDLYRQRLTGADFEPVTGMFPEFVYRRALMFWCQTSISVPEEEVGYISNVETSQTEYRNPNLGGGLDE